MKFLNFKTKYIEKNLGSEYRFNSKCLFFSEPNNLSLHPTRRMGSNPEMLDVVNKLNHCAVPFHFQSRPLCNFTFEDFLELLKNDPNLPKIELQRKEFFISAVSGQRAQVFRQRCPDVEPTSGFGETIPVNYCVWIAATFYALNLSQMKQM